ncbi:class I SAM-dependent methyltransferase [Kitasatospora purpeofusca]|uniref:class I SAM-dependent methyltransferase n=1 Tax=Kitasatospora purpeofusca TaxID=67352 RepID=UPI0022507E85|nr:class I SAM-dependent methyltransferase [Kitasatospora purpeofusca]MCX4758646.1 class I SAM-dependent methyltransferase [Kitasatospora purpeofusca]WSR30919.1 class I SAM-dependent methyltransferase [Kitasatospora purpeofusca]
MSAADHWNDHYKQGKGFRPVAELEVDLLTEHLGPGNGRRALDVGCGTGEYSAALHDLGFQVTGVDFSEVAVATAQDRHRERDGLDFRLLDVDRGSLDMLPAGEFDLITCRLFLPFADLVPTVAGARRLLVPGGRLLVTTPLAERQRAGWESIGLRSASLDLLRAFGWSAVAEYPLDDLLCLLLTTHGAPERTSR